MNSSSAPQAPSKTPQQVASEKPGTRRNWRPALAGIASVIAGLGVAELVAAVFAPAASPVLVVGAFVIDIVPSWVKDAVIALFGTGDKVALIVCIGLALLALSAVAGFLEFTRPPLGRLVVVVVGAVALFAALSRADASPFDALPAVASIIVSALLLSFLARHFRAEPGITPAVSPSRAGTTANSATAGRTAGVTQSDAHTAASSAKGAGNTATSNTTTTSKASKVAANKAAARAAAAAKALSLDRRRFLAWTGASAGLGILAMVGGQLISAGSRAVDTARTMFTLPKATTAAPPIPAGASLDVPGIAPLITPNADYYRIDTALQVPRIDPRDWRLRIIGMVENEIEIDFAELLALPLEESYTTLACVSNPVGGDLIGNAKWLGYPVRDLLAKAKPHADADMVLSRSQDGWTAGTPIEALTDDRNAIIAVGMNGEPLPLEHGYPVRMVVPGLYGYVSATKWLVELELTRFDRVTAYWTDRGWGEKGPVKLESRIDVPNGPAKAGVVTVAGVAWAQHTGISAVHVQVDEGDWNEATLADAISADTWRQWRWDWDAEPGEHTLQVRATDADGLVQTSTRRDVVPDGATGWHGTRVSVGA
ncbi:molybdopterin-dependent oxidoreductase [Glaciibacter superstes]|uniref:molybdopterin-dependent oxidoreductase n=1 Tax=Glaciibacter superstes TaxID=501023 RepID=UPI0003B6C7E3|nr:molybdopterin-dependent oxidoreductase [Glaciibacter superstes]